MGGRSTALPSRLVVGGGPRYAKAAVALDFTARFERALTDLHAAGLNWAVFVEAGPGLPVPEALASPRGAGLLLLLNLGPYFVSRALADEGPSDPVDRASARRADGLVRDVLRAHDPEAQRVYPDGPALDLRRWLAAGRVQYASPLGTGIRPDAGPWMAVRAAVWTRLPSAAVEALRRQYPRLSDGGSPCARCETAPCIPACPAGSLHPSRAPAARDLEACIDHRLSSASTCAERCLAREACPVGEAYRYPPAQIRYHYAASLVTLRRWRAGG